jgi:Cys-tRNA(Pro)/Cys-tRNA(Cys) deacylase
MPPAIEAAAAAGIKIGVHPYEHDPDNQKYGLEAAEALGVPLAHVFKTLAIDIGATMDSRYALVVAPVPRTLKLKAAALGQKKAVMAAPHHAERVTGYVPGGISPLGTRTQLPIVIDNSACDLDHIYCSGGKRELDISIRWEDLVLLTTATLASITR